MPGYAGPGAGQPGRGAEYPTQAAMPGQSAGYPSPGAGYPGQGAGYPGQGAGTAGSGGGPGWAPPQQAMTSAKGFAASLLDFSFSSFVTPTIIKFLYVLGMILIGLTALWWIALGFITGTVLYAIFMLIIAVVFFVVLIALWRISLEIYMVIFRMADDMKAIRERGGAG